MIGKSIRSLILYVNRVSWPCLVDHLEDGACVLLEREVLDCLAQCEERLVDLSLRDHQNVVINTLRGDGMVDQNVVINTLSSLREACRMEPY